MHEFVENVIAEQFGSSQWAVALLWKDSKPIVRCAPQGRCQDSEAQIAWDPEAVQVALKELPFNERKTARSAAAKLGIPHSTLQ